MSSWRPAWLLCRTLLKIHSQFLTKITVFQPSNLVGKASSTLFNLKKKNILPPPQMPLCKSRPAEVIIMMALTISRMAMSSTLKVVQALILSTPCQRRQIVSVWWDSKVQKSSSLMSIMSSKPASCNKWSKETEKKWRKTFLVLQTLQKTLAISGEARWLTTGREPWLF